MGQLVGEFKEWGEHFSGAEVGFQFGYDSDRRWWEKLEDPVGGIGKALIEGIPNCKHIYWVDFTIKDIYKGSEVFKAAKGSGEEAGVSSEEPQVAGTPVEEVSVESEVIAGWRSTLYGYHLEENPDYWVGAAEFVSSRIPDSTAGGLWGIGGIWSYGCFLDFPAPAEVDPSDEKYKYIIFGDGEQNEAYLDAFDEAGLKVWLQVEPHSADIETLIELVLGRYGHHESVIGFGVDVEWLEPSRVEATAALLESGAPEEITSLQEMKNGTIIEISGSDFKKIAESVPVVIKLETSAQNKGKIHYALATANRYYSFEEYGGYNLFNWIDGSGTAILDGVNAGVTGEKCSDWSGQRNAISIDLSNYSGGEKIELLTALAVPKETYFSLLCAPEETTITIYYFDGTASSYSAGKGILNGGPQQMFPIGFYSKNSGYSFAEEGKFIEQAIEQVKEGKAYIEESGGKKYVKWNLSRMLEEALGVYVPQEPGPTIEPPETLENRSPEITSVAFEPMPVGVEDNLKCIVKASDPDNDPLTYTFIWIIDGKKYADVETDKSSTILYAKDYQKQPGQEFVCEVTVSDGKTQAGPISARITIAEEHAEEQGTGELKDSDGDGIPDERDECPYEDEHGRAINKGCLPKEGAPCIGEEACRDIDCGHLNCFPVYGSCQNDKCVCVCGEKPAEQAALVPKSSQVLFVFMPIDWQGSQESFGREMEAQLAFLREKSGIADAAECSDLEFEKKALPKSLASECGISVSPYIDDPALLLNITNCMKRRVGIPLNHRKTIFAGLTDIEPGESLGQKGFVDKKTGRGGINGFHIVPSPPAPGTYGYQGQKEAFEAYKNTKITIAMASFVDSPEISFQALSHEIGHCLGFCEQYSLIRRVEQESMFAHLGFGGCTNEYAGSYQVQGRNITADLLSSNYQKCPNETTPTSCPEFVMITAQNAIEMGFGGAYGSGDNVLITSKQLIEESQRLRYPKLPIVGFPNVDCLGRRFFENGKEARDMMGPGSFSVQSWSPYLGPSYSLNPERSFDCFEKEQFIKQWCSS